MKKEELIRKILIFVFFAIAVVGGFMMLTRGNPLDKSIGNVFITNGSQRMEVEGYKFSYNNGDNVDEVEKFTSIDKAKEIPEIDYYPNDENCKLQVAYNEEYAGDLAYTVYDESFNCIVDSQPTLVMPGEFGKKYYVESSVNWGNEKKNVTVKYYFAINVK